MRKKIFHGLLWFQITLMNIGLGFGTTGLILLIMNTPPLIEMGIFPILLGLIYTFLYTLLVVGVIGIDCLVYQKGITILLKEPSDA